MTILVQTHVIGYSSFILRIKVHLYLMIAFHQIYNIRTEQLTLLFANCINKIIYTSLRELNSNQV